jgi:NADPH-dependent 2,4-dienoyl-CoA reductase/sulfur reductase-like enzyme
VVIGAGFIGSEVASSARKRGLDVTILEAAPTPLVRAVGADGGSMVSLLHQLHGTRLTCGVAVSGVTRTAAGLEVRLHDGSSLPGDLVVVGIGAVPATDWLEGSGVKVDDGVVCDAKLWTGLPGVYAAGDVARWPNGSGGGTVRLEHWTSAAEQASVATLNALGITDDAYTTVPYFWSDWYGVRIQMVGVVADDEFAVIRGSADEGKFVALYRDGDRLAGALCVGFPAMTMKLRRLIAADESWKSAVEFVSNR